MKKRKGTKKPVGRIVGSCDSCGKSLSGKEHNEAAAEIACHFIDDHDQSIPIAQILGPAFSLPSTVARAVMVMTCNPSRRFVDIKLAQGLAEDNPDLDPHEIDAILRGIKLAIFMLQQGLIR